MEIRHLRYFVAVAETCHFGRAAERLHIAQPALSHAIRQLEAEVDAALFTRTTRQVALTPAGEFLYDEARRTLARLDATVQGLHRIADGRVGMIRLGLTGTTAFSHLPRIVRALKAALPEVAVDVSADMLTPAQCDALRDGTLDLGVLRPPAAGEDVELEVFEREPLILAMPADHPLARTAELALAELRSEPFLLYGNPDSSVNEAVLRACRLAGFMPRREQGAAGTSVLLAMVAAGLGVALVPAGIRALPLAGVVFHDVTDAGTVDLAFAWHAGDDNPLVASVREVLGLALAADPLGSGAPR